MVGTTEACDVAAETVPRCPWRPGILPLPLIYWVSQKAIDNSKFRKTRSRSGFTICKNKHVIFHFSISYLANSSEDTMRQKSPSCSQCTKRGLQCPDYKSYTFIVYHPAQPASCGIMNLPLNIRFAEERDIKWIAEIEEFGNEDVAISHLFNGFETRPSQRIQRRCDELQGIMNDPEHKNWDIFVILEGEKVVGAAIIVVPSSSTSWEQVIVSLRYAQREIYEYNIRRTQARALLNAWLSMWHGYQ